MLYTLAYWRKSTSIYADADICGRPILTHQYVSTVLFSTSYLTLLPELFSHCLSLGETWGPVSCRVWGLQWEKNCNQAFNQEVRRALQTHQVTSWQWCRTIQLNTIIYTRWTILGGVFLLPSEPRPHCHSLSPSFSWCLHKEMAREMGLMESSSTLRQILIS